jgi:hypothetical protein
MSVGAGGHVLVKTRREVRTYAEVWHASRSMLRIAEEHGKGQTWLLMASVVFTAFAFEAYLNHVGPRVDPAWADRMRGFLPVRKKFDHLSATLGVAWAKGWKAEPLLTVSTVIGFRNAMAHAKSETLKPPPTLHPLADNPFDDLHYRPLAEWETRLRDDRFALAARAAVEETLARLHDARTDEDKEPLFMMGMTVTSGSFVAADDAAPNPEGSGR